MHKMSLMKSFAFGLLLALFFWVGFLIRGKLSAQALGSLLTRDSAGVQESDLNIFWETWNILSEKYPFDDQEPSTAERVYGATAGMVDSFHDPHTIFLNPEEAELFKQDVNGAFGGVGMEIDTRDGLVIVVAPLKGSPAEKAGIESGDIIFSVNDTSVYDMDIDSVIALIRGKKGTEVTLSLLREGAEDTDSEKLDITVVRDTIAIPTIDYKKLTPDIFYISLYSFTQKSFDLMQEALDAFHDSGAHALIFDLRSNPGGYLQAGVEIGSLFLPEGNIIVKEHSGDTKDDIIFRSLGYDALDFDIPIVVLVDGGSASASEIVAGALQEHGRAELVGSTTFGKGSVQELIQLSDASALKVTVAQWLTPNGSSLSNGGLTPDYEITNRIDEEGKFVDEQLIKAQELLEKELAS
ncbi:S41 family peptidase [Candidatus Nomurabacteria bacterium]|nr:S41 family peptidase [Candidatus Nomurabacteria bacterium]